MEKYLKILFFIMLCNFISSCTSLSIFDEEDLFFEHKPSNEEPLKNANPDQQAKQQSEIQPKTKVQPEKLRRIEKPQPEKIKPVEKPLSEKPKLVEKPLSEKPKLVEKPQSEKPKRVEKRQPKKIRTVKRPQPRKQQPKPQIYEEDLNPTDILSSYRLGAGDKISIKVFGEPDFSVTTHLSETGTISYPFLGELKLAGLTINQIEKRIISGLNGDYLINPKVTITILEYRKVFVNGEVGQPGGYSFVPGLTVEKVISLAGGFSEIASHDDISIVRNGNPTANPVLVKLKTYVRPGDIIFIKESAKFFMDGEVRKPGAYIFKPGMTVKKAISLAGGFTEIASRDTLSVIYKKNEVATSSPIDINDFVQPGDIITVKESAKFFMDGEVRKPGAYIFKPGMTVKKAISLAGGFTEIASRDTLSVIYKKNEVATSSPIDINDFIQPGDIITVKESSKFFMDGEVRNQGAYIFQSGMTVKKAISLAGGFTDRASREKIFVIHKKDEMAEPLLININDLIQPGDIITVEAYQKFFVKGEVKSPGAYPYELGLTVEKAISIAGGLTEFASLRKIFVLRNGSEKAITVDLNIPIQPGDIITVKEGIF